MTSKVNNDFPDAIVGEAFIIAKEKCENCDRELCKESRGKESFYGWEAHHKDPYGPGTLDNCIIPCQDCHKATNKYPKS